MKRLLICLCLALSAFVFVQAQDKSYRVVFDLTSRDTLDQKAVMRWVGEISAANPEARLEVVMYGKGFELVMPEKSAFVAQVNSAIRNPNVSFKVCQAALKNNNVDRSRIMADAQTVPDGIYEILMRQREGWGYIKVGTSPRVTDKREDRYFRPCGQPDRGSPVACPLAHVDPGIGEFVKSLDVGLPDRRNQVPWKELASMRMSGNLNVKPCF